MPSLTNANKMPAKKLLQLEMYQVLEMAQISMKQLQISMPLSGRLAFPKILSMRRPNFSMRKPLI
jgi:hypothetical protein